MLGRLLRPVVVVLAIVFLIEAWLWDHLEPIVALLVAAIPLRALKQWLAERVDTLSPAMTLIMLVVPLIPLFPLKMIALWLLAHDHFMRAVATFLFAKFAGVGVSAFVFDVTRGKLLENGLIQDSRSSQGQGKSAGRSSEGRYRGDGNGLSRTLRLVQRFREERARGAIGLIL